MGKPKIAPTLDRALLDVDGVVCIGCGEYPAVIVQSDFVAGTSICGPCARKAVAILRANRHKLPRRASGNGNGGTR